MVRIRPRVTLSAINAAIKANGGAEELVRGDDYFYFAGGTAPEWPQSGVYVARLGQNTVAQWVEEWRRLRDDFLRSKP